MNTATGFAFDKLQRFYGFSGLCNIKVASFDEIIIFSKPKHLPRMFESHDLPKQEADLL